MSQELSLYLDIVRFLAAATVFIDHVSWPPLTGGGFLKIVAFFGFGTQAVDVFFVLSGFVIGYVTEKQENSPTSYVIHRAGRLYSVVVPSLILTMIFDALGDAARPELYSTIQGFSGTIGIWKFVISALFLNEVWSFNVIPGTDLPFWSLGYEAWYYVVFGIFAFGSKRIRFVWAAAALLIAGPRIAALFPLWFSGVLCYRVCTRLPIGMFPATYLWLISVIGFFYYEVWYFHAKLLGRAPGSIQIRSFDIWNDYVIGALFAGSVIGFRYGLPSLLFRRLLNILARPIRWTAGATFSLYLLHFPAMLFIGALSPWPPSSWETRSAIVFGTFIVVFIAAAFTERRKVAWQRIVAWCLDALARCYAAVNKMRTSKQLP